jgi:hypothetical protein
VLARHLGDERDHHQDQHCHRTGAGEEPDQVAEIEQTEPASHGEQDHADTQEHQPELAFGGHDAISDSCPL